jgi:hypothetical protein
LFKVLQLLKFLSIKDNLSVFDVNWLSKLHLTLMLIRPLPIENALDFETLTLKHVLLANGSNVCLLYAEPVRIPVFFVSKLHLNIN